MDPFSQSRSSEGPLETAALEQAFSYVKSGPRAEHDSADGAHFGSLANLAHELRTPVQVLLGYLDILRDGHSDTSDSDSAESSDRTIIDRMNTNVHELAQTVENVLEFVLASAGAETAIEEEIELVEFFAEMDEFLAASNVNRHLTVCINLDDAPRTVITRRRPLRSIVLNLALNAIKFTTDGEVTVSLLRCTGEPQSIVLEVRDTGAGISRDLLSSAFEPLVQLSHSSIRRHRGLGLGLAIVQRHVSALGGRLQVESILGAGSCFKVTIPCTHCVPGVCTSGHPDSNVAC
jgi:signal transduction histidine kinase